MAPLGNIIKAGNLLLWCSTDHNLVEEGWFPEHGKFSWKAVSFASWHPSWTVQEGKNPAHLGQSLAPADIFQAAVVPTASSFFHSGGQMLSDNIKCNAEPSALH